MTENFLAYIFSAFCIAFFFYMAFGDAISYYKLQDNKEYFWREYFPNYLKSNILRPLATLIALLLVVWFIELSINRK
jgi:hypothetical protein